MTTRITRTTTVPDGESTTVTATRGRDGRWLLEPGGGRVPEAAMRRRVLRIEPWTLTAFALEGLTAADVIPRLAFAPEEDEPDWDWDDVALPDGFSEWRSGTSYLDVAHDPYPLVIDGASFTLHGDLVCPLAHGDIRLGTSSCSMRWNNSGSRTYGPDLILSVGEMPGYGAALMRHDDPDCYDRTDQRAWLLPRVHGRVDAAFALLDAACRWGTEYEWVDRRLYMAAMLMTLDDPRFSVDEREWALNGYGCDVDGDELGVWYALDSEDRPAVERRVARRLGRRFVRWIAEGRPAPNGLATITHAELVSQMQPVPDRPGMLASPDPDIARRVVEMEGAAVRVAWAESDAGTAELLRARAIDTQLAVVRRDDEVLPCRAIPCPWERPRRVEAADDAFLAWFAEEHVSTGDLFSPSARWHVPARPGTHARDVLLMRVADGIASGLWRALVDDAGADFARLGIVVPADPDDERYDDGSPGQREDVLDALVARQRALAGA